MSSCLCARASSINIPRPRHAVAGYTINTNWVASHQTPHKARGRVSVRSSSSLGEERLHENRHCDGGENRGAQIAALWRLGHFPPPLPSPPAMDALSLRPGQQAHRRFASLDIFNLNCRGGVKTRKFGDWAALWIHVLNYKSIRL